MSASSMAQHNNSVYYEEGHYKNQVILCSSGYDHTIRFWNADKGFCERVIQNSDNTHVNAMAISPNRDILASVGFQSIRLYDIESGNSNPIINFEGLTKNVSCVGFNQSGHWLFTGGEDGNLRLSDIRSRSTLNAHRQRLFQTPINSAFLHSNGVEIYVADQSGSIYIWNLQADSLYRIFITNDGFIHSIAHDKESQMIAAVDTKGNCYIFTVAPNYTCDNENAGVKTLSGLLQKRLMFRAHEKAILKCAFSPDSTTLATASADRTIKLWRTSDFTVQKKTTIVRFDDPFDNITTATTGSASAFPFLHKPQAQTFKNAFAYSELDESMMFPSLPWALPFLDVAGYRFNSFMQFVPMRPTKCYLKPRRHCSKCTCKAEGVAASNTGGTSRNGVPLSGPDKHNNGSGASEVPASGPRENENPGASRRKKTSVTSMYSHIVNPQPQHTVSQSDSGPGPRMSRLNDKWFDDYKGPGSVDSSYSSSKARGPFRGLGTGPNVYGQYFRNKYYQLFSGVGVCKDLTEEEENAIDEEFYDYLKGQNLVEPSDDEDNIPEDDEGGSGSRSDQNADETASSSDGWASRRFGTGSARFGSKQRHNQKKVGGLSSGRSKCGDHCCCSCDCAITAESPFTGRTRRMSGNKATQSQSSQTGSKSEWKFSDSLQPMLTLAHENQRWVWDIAFTAESDYIFSASSDNSVRLWSVFKGELTREYTGHQKAVTSLAFSDLLI